MNTKIVQALGAFGGPLLTLGCTSLAVRYISAADDTRKAAGAALAGLVGFALAQVAEELPKRSFWWRQRFDPRAAFEGWWLQIHDNVDRTAVTSILYDGASDKYSAEGNAFNSAGDHLARWESTEVFFSTGSRELNYLWKGISHDKENAGPREGSTRISLDRAPNGRRPVTGHGDVQHLNLARVLEFRARRITPQLLKECGLSFSVEDLADYDFKRQLAQAFLRRTQQQVVP